MTPIVLTPGSPGATAEGFILDPDGPAPLDLGNNGWLRLAALTIPPAKRRPEWATNGDTDGSALVREPFYEDRACSMQVRVITATGDAAVAAIGQLEGKLQEAIKLAAGGGDGLAFLWTPSGASVGLRGYIKLAEITDMPVTIADGWFAHKPLLTVAFSAKPFLYGAEVTGPTATGTAPLLTLEVPDVPGDVSAEARLVVSDGSTQARRWAEWGLENFSYVPASPWSLLIDSEDLVTTGFAGAQATRTGAYRRASATHDTVSATLLAQTIAVCGTGNLPHVGVFRVKARVWAASTSQYWRLAWQDGDGPLTHNDWQQPVAAGDFSELDLGLIDVEPAQAGTQRWSGRIEAYTLTAGGELGEVDYLLIYPRGEGYGRLEGKYAYTAGVITGHDEFTGTTSGAALNGRAAPAGGTWATSGATTDFTFHDGFFSSGSEEIRRISTSDAGFRFAILGSTARTDTEVGAEVFGLSDFVSSDMCLVARWTDANNHLRLRVNGAGGFVQMLLEQLVAGVTTTLGASPAPLASVDWRLRLIAFSSGRVLGWLLDSNGNTLETIDAIDSALATGGALASGSIGLADRHTLNIAGDRYYDNFYVATPAAESVVINTGRSLEIRSDSNLRQSADGAAYADIPSRGSRLFIPQAGDANRTTRIAVRATREDPITNASRNDGDSLTLQVFYTPRYLAAPR